MDQRRTGSTEPSSCTNSISRHMPSFARVFTAEGRNGCPRSFNRGDAGNMGILAEIFFARTFDSEPDINAKRQVMEIESERHYALVHEQAKTLPQHLFGLY
jgi:hypothetical protein